MTRENRRRRRKMQMCFALLVLLSLLAYLIHKQILQDVFSPLPQGAVYRVNTGEKAVALTFDVVWETGQIGNLLDILDRYDARATFFITGSWLRKYSLLAKEIVLRGHEIGQHSQNHRSMTEMKIEEVAGEFEMMNETLREELNMATLLFRPPYGEINQEVCDFARQQGYTTVVWSINPEDWLNPGVDKIVRGVVKNLHSGAIILLHTSSAQSTEALPVIIQSIRFKGYRICTVSELLKLAEKK